MLQWHLVDKKGAIMALGYGEGCYSGTWLIRRVLLWPLVVKEKGATVALG